MGDIYDIVFGVMRERLPAYISLSDFKRYMSVFEFIPVIVGGECVGAIMRNKSELHAAVTANARGRWCGRRALEIIADTIRKYGMATTIVMDDHKAGHDFALRLGFELAGREGGMTYYEKTKC